MKPISTKTHNSLHSQKDVNIPPRTGWRERYHKQFPVEKVSWSLEEDKNIIVFIASELARREEEVRGLVAKDRPLFFRDQDKPFIYQVIQIRKQLRKEILADIDALKKGEGV